MTMTVTLIDSKKGLTLKSLDWPISALPLVNDEVTLEIGVGIEVFRIESRRFVPHDEELICFVTQIF